MLQEDGMQTATVVQWKASKIGARVGALMAQSYYPVGDASEGARVKTSVRLPVEQDADIKLIAQLWNELDKALGRKKSRKWKAASVIERLISVGIDGFWQQVGGRPPTQEGREDFIRRAVEHLAPETPKKAAKK